MPNGMRSTGVLSDVQATRRAPVTSYDPYPPPLQKISLRLPIGSDESVRTQVVGLCTDDKVPARCGDIFGVRASRDRAATGDGML
jgi:hypothetical protein